MPLVRSVLALSTVGLAGASLLSLGRASAAVGLAALVMGVLLLAFERARVLAPATPILPVREIAPDRTREVATAVTDLRAPIAAAKRLVQSVPLDRPLPPEGRMRDVLLAIDRELERMDERVADVLHTAHDARLVLRKSACDLEAVARACLDHHRAMSPSHRFELEVRGPRWIVADRLRIESVLHELVGNAIRVSPAGSEVRVAVESIDFDMCVSVSDRGITPIGSELGLRIARRIVEAHGGRLTMKSTRGVGTTVRFSIPRYPTITADA